MTFRVPASRDLPLDIKDYGVPYVGRVVAFEGGSACRWFLGVVEELDAKTGAPWVRTEAEVVFDNRQEFEDLVQRWPDESRVYPHLMMNAWSREPLLLNVPNGVVDTVRQIRGRRMNRNNGAG